MEQRVNSLRSHLAKLEAKMGKRLTDEQREDASKEFIAKAEKSATGGGSKGLPADSLLVVEAARIEQARGASSLPELRRLWSASPSAASSTTTATATIPSAERRIIESAAARDGRSTEKVVCVCRKEKSKVRVHVVSDGYDKTKNVQFPRDLRRDGAYFLVDVIVDAGKFYRAKGEIVPHEP